MPSIEDLEPVRTRLLGMLRRSAGQPQLGALTDFVLRAEDLVLTFVCQHAADVVVAGSGQALWRVGNQLVDAQGGRCLVSAVEAGFDRTVLDISLIPLSAAIRSDRRLAKSRKVRAPGRFRRIEVSVPEAFANTSTPLVEHAVLILETGYTWIAERILDLVSRIEVRVADSLYDLARDVFPENDLRREVWFATVGPLYGFRLMSPDVARSALDAFKRGTSRLPVSPLDLLGEFLQTRLPRDLLLMNIAVRNDDAMDVDLSHAGYTRSGSRYSLVLSVFYGGTSFTIVPLLRAAQFAVVALFPTGRTAIRARLEAHRQEFEHRASLLATEIIEAAELFEVAEPNPEDEPGGNVGQLLGSAVSEVRRASRAQRRAPALRLVPPRRAAND